MTLPCQTAAARYTMKVPTPLTRKTNSGGALICHGCGAGWGLRGVIPAGIVLVGIWLWGSGAAKGQDFERFAPKLPGDTVIIDPRREETEPEVRRQIPPVEEEAAPAVPLTGGEEGAPARPAGPRIRVEFVDPDRPSAFEELQPVFPGGPSNGESAFAEVMPRGIDLSDEYLAAIERAIQPFLEDELLPALKGLVFLDRPEDVKSAGVDADGVVASALPELLKPEFRAIADRYLGRPVTLQSLNELNREVVAYFNQNDFPVVDVIVPEQDITTGAVQLVVLQGRRGEIRVEGNRWFSDGLIAGQIRTERDRVLRAKKLMADLSWLNRNPFRRVNLVYARGAEVGQTDLILQVEDRFPVRFFAGYENTGNEATGDDRFFVGFNWGNVFGLDQQLNYQFTFNQDTDLFAAHTGSYLIPLPWRHLITGYGSTGTSDSNSFQAGLLRSTGTSTTGGIRYTAPLPGLGSFQHEIYAGFEYKHNDTTLFFGNFPIVESTTEVGQSLAGYTAGWRDRFGSTSFNGTFFYSPGGMTGDNNDAAFQTIRPLATAQYVYLRLSAERVQQLPLDFALIGRVTWQVADANLLASEQLGVGGYTTVRGYEEREASGDNGFNISFELRTPPISFGNLLGLRDFPGDQAQFLVFWDYADVSPKNPIPGQDENVILSSVGPGFRYAITPYFSLRIDYGFQLADSGVPSRWGSRAHIGMILSY